MITIKSNLCDHQLTFSCLKYMSAYYQCSVILITVTVIHLEQQIPSKN